jgi:phosphoribosylaminoimidazolecarboxamide formyltransferase/IMP cyclohydrolase
MIPDLVPIRRALLSVSDKTDLVPFARGLREAGVELVSTGGTATALRAAGVEALPIDRLTGFPEILDGRVKTLHPAVHGALLARRDLPAHAEALAAHRIQPIDLVCVNLYPFEQTVAAGAVAEAEAIEQIDIGGPAMLRSAAKNHAWVTVVTAASQYDMVITDLRANQGSSSATLRRWLASAAFARTAEYDTAISAWMSGRGATATAGFPEMLQLSYPKVRDLRYGENPHQKAAVYADPSGARPSVATAHVLHGKPLSYNNLLDGAAALELVQELGDLDPRAAAAVLVKHTSPCGAALDPDPAAAFELAHAGDPGAAYGGILAVNRPMTAALAERVSATGRFLEVIIAPSFDDAARAQLASRWTSVRLLAVGPTGAASRGGLAVRSIPGGLLAQEYDLRPANVEAWQHVAGPTPDAATRRCAALSWTVAKHLKSNAVAIGAGTRLLGAGCGAVDRVTACQVALRKAEAGLAGLAGEVAVAASDGFFPFADGPAALIEGGVGCLVHPGGSIRDQETVDLCHRSNVTCLLTGVRHFRH